MRAYNEETTAIGAPRHGTGKGGYPGCKCQACRDHNARRQWRRRHPGGEPWPGDLLSHDDVIDVLLEVLAG